MYPPPFAFFSSPSRLKNLFTLPVGLLIFVVLQSENKTAASLRIEYMYFKSTRLTWISLIIGGPVGYICHHRTVPRHKSHTVSFLPFISRADGNDGNLRKPSISAGTAVHWLIMKVTPISSLAYLRHGPWL